MEVGAQGLAQTNYLVRSAAFAYLFIVVAVVLWECGADRLAWALMVLQFLVYPHLVYWRARFSPRPTRAELDNLFLDAALLAAWCAALGFPTWLTFGVVSATTLNAVVNRGLQGLAWSITCSAGGAVLWILVRGLHYTPQTSELVTVLCILGVFAYLVAVGSLVRCAAARRASG
jgi:diguanylate cyclase